MKLMNDLILVRPTKETQKKNGLIIPNGIENQNKGEIVLIGSKVQKLKVGDKIIYTSNQGTPLNYENEPMILLSESRNELFLDD